MGKRKLVVNALNVVMVTAECSPFVYGGGLGEVPPALARNLEKSFGFLNCHVVFPRSHPSLRKDVGDAVDGFRLKFQGDDVDVGVHKTVMDKVNHIALSGGKLDWALYRDGREEEKNFLFCRAAHEYIKTKLLPEFGEESVVVHAHDWHSAMTLPLFALDPGIKRPVALTYTIHNYFRKSFPKDVLGWFNLDWFHDGEGIIDPITHQINPDRTGVFFSHEANTVSSDYRNTLLKYPELDWASRGKLKAVLNGTDPFDERVQKLKTRYSEISQLVGEDLNKYPRLYENDFDGMRGRLKDELKDRLFDIARREKIVSLLKEKYNVELGFHDWKDGFLFTFVSRLTFQKGVDLVVDAFPAAEKRIMEKTGRDARLVILGTGDVPDTKNFTKNMLLIEAFSKEIRDLLYLAGDAFIMPSRYEPCGLTPFEAMSCGTPVIVNPVGGLKEIVNECCGEFMQTEFYQDTNLKIGDRDMAVTALTDAIERMALRLNDPRQRESIIEGCLKRVNDPRFSWETVASGYLTKLYIPAIDAAKSAHAGI